MEFDWDDKKNQLNYRKHSIWFEEAQTVWADKQAIEFFDSEHQKGEDRFLRVGYSSHERLLLVVFCERSNGDLIRIISARKATKSERNQYEEGI
jgi:uncharacterized DUF497 family protein